MSQYYYLIASLPALNFDGGLKITKQKFMETCKDFLTDEDYKILQRSSILNPDIKKVHNINKIFWNWEKALRNRLVSLRAHKMGLHSKDYIREGEDLLEVHYTAVEAFKQDSPIHAEYILNKARWDFLENLSTGHYFGIEVLIIYYLQLQILDRISNFDTKRGFDKYQEIYSGIVDNIDVEISGENK